MTGEPASVRRDRAAWCSTHRQDARVPTGKPGAHVPFAAPRQSAPPACVGPAAPHEQTLLLGRRAIRQSLTRRATIHIRRCFTGEVGFHKVPPGPTARCVRTRHGRGNACLMADQYLLGAEGALVSKNMHLFQVRHIPDLLPHPCQKIPVVALTGDLMGDDQMGFGIDNPLNIIANMPAVLRAGRRSPEGARAAGSVRDI